MPGYFLFGLAVDFAGADQSCTKAEVLQLALEALAAYQRQATANMNLLRGIYERNRIMEVEATNLYCTVAPLLQYEHVEATVVPLDDCSPTIELLLNEPTFYTHMW